MALFSKEPKTSKSRESVKPATPSIPPEASQRTQTVSYEDARVSSCATSPAAQGMDVHTYLNKSSRIVGKLFFEGSVRIDGQVDGEITAKEVVEIGETAVVTGQLKAGSVVIAGKMSGDVSATKRVEIRPTAKLFGNLITPLLAVHEGAMFEGHCTMSPEAKEDSKIAPAPAPPKQERLIPQATPDGKKLS